MTAITRLTDENGLPRQPKLVRVIVEYDNGESFEEIIQLPVDVSIERHTTEGVYNGVWNERELTNHYTMRIDYRA